MIWKLGHEDLAVNDDSKVVSRPYLILEENGVQIKLGQKPVQEGFVFGTKRVLIDTASLLRKLAHEMENKAEKIA